MEEKIAQFRFNGYKILESSIKIKPQVKPNEQLHVSFEKTVGLKDSEKEMRLEMITKIEDEAGDVSIEVNANGFFEFDGVLSDEMKNNFFNTNAPAILFPYIRAYITTLSALSGIEPIILPTLNLSDRS